MPLIGGGEAAVDRFSFGAGALLNRLYCRTPLSTHGQGITNLSTRTPWGRLEGSPVATLDDAKGMSRPGPRAVGPGRELLLESQGGPPPTTVSSSHGAWQDSEEAALSHEQVLRAVMREWLRNLKRRSSSGQNFLSTS